MTYDIISVGSGTVDIFVETTADLIKIKKGKETEEMLAYPAGDKILVSHIQEEVGGSGVNAAVGFSRLGLKTGFFGVLSTDKYAKNVLELLEKENIKFLGVRKDLGTNISVILDSQYDDRTILVYKNVSESLEKKDLKKLDGRWLYCTTMKGKAFNTLELIVSDAKKRGMKVAFNSSMYLTKQGIKKCEKIFRHTDILVLNKEEAKALFNGRNEVNDLLKKLSKYVKIPAVTDGKNGAFVLINGIIYHAKPKKNLKIKETTGAGDAFSSGFISGFLLQLPPEDCLKLGMLNSESVIKKIGATNDVLTKEKAFKLLKTDRRTVSKLHVK